MLAKVSRFNFSKKHTIFILAGGPHQDATGAQLIRTIKQKNPQTQFIGVGGPLMETEGLAKSYADINKFCFKPFFPIKNFLHFHIERPYHPYLAYYHYKNRIVRNQIDKSTLFEDVLETKPSAFITLSNDFFMSRLFNHLNNVYYKNGLVKAPCFHFDRTHINQRFEFQSYLDYAFSVIPKKAVNYQFFNFPSTVVGHEGIGRAWQYLYKNSSKFSELQSNDHIYLSPENNKQIIEQLVQEQRVKARKQLGISEKQQVIYFAPGDHESECKFSFLKFTQGIKEFFTLDQVKSIGQENYTVVISIPQQNDKLVESLAGNANFGCQTIVVKDKYAAMCASDVALCHNGQIVSECAAVQLPVIVIDSLPFPQAYTTQLYNTYNNDLNITSNGETFPELLSVGCTSYRVSRELHKFLSDPRWRYYLADKLGKHLYNMVPTVGQQGDNSSEITHGNQTFVKHTFTFTSMANKILSAADIYQSSDKKLPAYKIPEYREEFIKQIKLAH